MMTNVVDMMVWLDERSPTAQVKATFTYRVTWMYKASFLDLVDQARVIGLEVNDQGHRARLGARQGTLVVIGPVYKIKLFIQSLSRIITLHGTQ